MHYKHPYFLNNLIKCSELKNWGIVESPSQTFQSCFSKREKDVYPLYELGWKDQVRHYFSTLSSIKNLYAVGRRGLFLHCNMDHCMHMGRMLADHIGEGSDKEKWEKKLWDFYEFIIKD